MNFIRILCPCSALLVAVAAPAQSPLAQANKNRSAAIAQAQVNDPAEKVAESIQAGSLWSHMLDFQQIADDNPGHDGHGNRDTGTSGYKASVDYVAGLMQDAGYSVTIQQYNYRNLKVVGQPRFTASGQSYVLNQDWFVARLSGGGKVSAQVQPAKGSGTGRAASEWQGFVPGHIALLQRGSCSYDVQVANAHAAGAAGVILYNHQAGDYELEPRGPDDGSAFAARLTTPASVPVIGMASYSVGAELRRQYEAGDSPVVSLDIPTQLESGIDYNLIAESPFGDENHTVVVDAHLDSIFGAGMLDNASGSTTILEVALKAANTSTRNRLRYIWFGGEELGLLGSRYYTQNLSAAERQKIAFDIDVDVTATPNYDYLIADPGHASNVDQFPPNVVPESKIGNRIFLTYFNSIGVPAGLAWFGNNGTDSNSFSLIGIPNTGILTLQDCCKAKWEVQIWGGFLGNYEGNIPSFDGGCVDRPRLWCDNLDNNDPVVLETASKATAYAIFKLANHPFTE